MWSFTICNVIQFVDSMSLYARIRKTDSKEPHYSLDAISTKEIGTGKLQFTEGSHYEMQQLEIIRNRSGLYGATIIDTNTSSNCDGTLEKDRYTAILTAIMQYGDYLVRTTQEKQNSQLPDDKEVCVSKILNTKQFILNKVNIQEDITKLLRCKESHDMFSLDWLKNMCNKISKFNTLNLYSLVITIPIDSNICKIFNIPNTQNQITIYNCVRHNISHSNILEYEKFDKPITYIHFGSTETIKIEVTPQDNFIEEN